MRPPVTVVTPTMPSREGVLVSRCIPSVQRQKYDGVIDHIIVSDRNPGIGERIAGAVTTTPLRPVQVVEINDTWVNDLTRRCTGNFPWRHGCFMAHGDFVGFLGDDDEYLEHHVATAVDRMEETGAVFTVAQVAFYGHGTYALTIGDGSFELGHLDATGVVCRREALRTANWDIAPLSEKHANAGDYRMVRDWLRGGLAGSFIAMTTANHHDGWLVGASGV